MKGIRYIAVILLQCTWGIGATLIVGILSAVWGSHPYFVRMRKEKNIRYTSFFIEAWASRWGEKDKKEVAIWG